MMNDAIKQFFDEVPKAREVIYDVGSPTLLHPVQLDGEEFDLYIKREDLGPIKAYKWRGGYNAVLNHYKNTQCDTIVAASAGNHAQGVALAAHKLKIQAKIFMPLAAPLMKQKAVEHHGGEYVELILTGDTYNQAGDAAKDYVQKHGYTYIHPFDDIYTMAGQAMIADEIITDTDKPFDYAFLQIGGGGMAGATAAMLKQKWPNIKIIGVEGVNQASMKASIKAGQPITLEAVDTFCDGTAVTRPGDLTFQLCQDFIDEFITVTNENVSAAMRQLWDSIRLIPEPSGAMGVAGIKQYEQQNPNALKNKKILCIICGANMDFSKLSSIVQKSAVGNNTRRYYRIQLPEGKGMLLKVLEKHFQNLNVSEFMYGKINDKDAWQTIAIDGKNIDFETLENSLKQDCLEFSDITHDIDIRYKIINYNPLTFTNPVFMNVQFPERKGALRDFLRKISRTANICYFNYAYSGEAIGRALMGFEFINTTDKNKFFDAIKETNTQCEAIDSETEKRILKH